MFRRIVKREVLDSLARHEKVTEDFIKRVKKIPKRVIENLGDELSKTAVKLSREVNSEIHSNKAFLRLSVTPHGILYAKIEIEHHVEEQLIHFFSERFPMFVIILESKRGVYSGQYGKTVECSSATLSKVVKEWEKILPINPILDSLNEGDYHRLWEDYAESQMIWGKKQAKAVLRLNKHWNRKKSPIVPSTTKKLDEFFKLD